MATRRARSAWKPPLSKYFSAAAMALCRVMATDCGGKNWACLVSSARAARALKETGSTNHRRMYEAGAKLDPCRFRGGRRSRARAEHGGPGEGRREGRQGADQERQAADQGRPKGWQHRRRQGRQGQDEVRQGQAEGRPEGGQSAEERSEGARHGHHHPDQVTRFSRGYGPARRKTPGLFLLRRAPPLLWCGREATT